MWSEDALAELDRTIAYLAARNPDAARRVPRDIREAGSSLGHAATGCRGRVDGTYEKVGRSPPYILAYTLDKLPEGGERVVILHVIHTSRDWPQGGWPNA